MPVPAFAVSAKPLKTSFLSPGYRSPRSSSVCRLSKSSRRVTAGISFDAIANVIAENERSGVLQPFVMDHAADGIVIPDNERLLHGRLFCT